MNRPVYWSWEVLDAGDSTPPNRDQKSRPRGLELWQVSAKPALR